MRACGRITRPSATRWCRATSRRRSRPRRPWATTACSANRRATSCRSRSRTAPRRSACAGSSAAWRGARRETATRRRRRSERHRVRKLALAAIAAALRFLVDPLLRRLRRLRRLGLRFAGFTRGAAVGVFRHHLAVDRLELLADARGLAREPAQVIELRAPHLALALHLDRGERRRIRLERALHALAARDLAHDERGVEAAVALGDHHAFVRLLALLVALDDDDLDDDGVAGAEVG